MILLTLIILPHFINKLCCDINIELSSSAVEWLFFLLRLREVLGSNIVQDISNSVSPLLFCLSKHISGLLTNLQRLSWKASSRSALFLPHETRISPQLIQVLNQLNLILLSPPCFLGQNFSVLMWFQRTQRSPSSCVTTVTYCFSMVHELIAPGQPPSWRTTYY
jgi:hypothetical protein